MATEYLNEGFPFQFLTSQLFSNIFLLLPLPLRVQQTRGSTDYLRGHAEVQSAVTRIKQCSDYNRNVPGCFYTHIAFKG